MVDEFMDPPNPYAAPSSSPPPLPLPLESADLTTVDWLFCIFCSGIACILGIVRLIQGKPSAGKMIGVSILFSLIWGFLQACLTASSQR